MLSAAWLIWSAMLCSLQLSTGTFPKPLTPQEERHYLQLASQGDLEARNILIQRNLRLVAHIMKKYYATGADQEDLISIGTIGLIKGISTFDPSKSSRLATYAARCVENATLSPTTFTPSTRWHRVAKGRSGALDRISADLYLLSWAQNSHVRYAPLYIHSFVLCAPRKILEATMFNQRYRRYEEIQNVPDRLRWLRHSRGLIQTEVAVRIGMSRHTYMNIEEGITRQIPKEMRDKLAQFYGVPAMDFIDEFSRFIEDGQAIRIRAIRTRIGLSRREFARQMGIPVRSLEVWENEKKVISYKSWEKYFKGKA